MSNASFVAGPLPKIWVYVGEKNDPIGIQIDNDKLPNPDVDDLRKAIKVEVPDLADCAASDLMMRTTIATVNARDKLREVLWDASGVLKDVYVDVPKATGRKRPLTSQPVTGPSKSRHARDEVGKFLELLEVADEYNIEVVIGNLLESVSPETSATFLKEKLDQMGDNLSIVEHELTLNDEEDMKDLPNMQLERLRKETESAVQQSLTQTLFAHPIFNAVDSHQRLIGPNAKLAQKKMIDAATGEEVEAAVYTFTGRPDAMGPGIDLELKPKRVNASNKEEEDEAEATATQYQVLQQAMERVLTRAILAGHLMRFVALAATGSNCWALTFTRKIEQWSMGTISIQPISYRSADVIWAKWTRLVATKPKMMLTADGPSLVHAIRSLGYDPAYCLIKLHCQSTQSRVYFISLPKMYRTLSNVQVRAVAAKPDLVIKIVVSEDAYDREVSVLKRLEAEYKKDTSENKSTPYFLGWTGHFVENSLPPPPPDFPFLENAWWQNIPSESGRAIFMQIGRDLPEELSQDNIDQILCALRNLHQIGWVHCDIRRPNLLQFENNSIHLIDYGLARPIDNQEASRCEVDREHLGPRAQKEYETPLLWTPADDYEMAMRMLTRQQSFFRLTPQTESPNLFKFS